MEHLAPPVVAVIVTCDPGSWFEECLRSLAEQDYAELSVLVLDAGSVEDPTARVAAVLPDAYVRRLPDNLGFGASVNAVLDMVQGASHLLVCHDDVALDPETVHVLVEESFRSNAGVVGPKFVAWDDAGRLLHVGMAVDKGGAVVDRVEAGEIDHGQHDAVRDVFLAPGGCTLVRADLFTELGGFDPGIAVMGEDLDLCWRAQVAGARVVVAPGARVRHLERLASGKRALPAAVLAGLPGERPARREPSRRRRRRRGRGHDTGDGIAAGRGARRWRSPSRPVQRPALQALQRRHELRVALTAYGRFHLARVLPQLVVLALAEMAVALLTGSRDRAAVLAHAWRWNWDSRAELRARRASVSALRRLPDADVRRLQLHGSARLTAYLRRAVTHGLQVAHIGGEEELLELRELEEAEERAERRRRELGLTGRIAAVVAVGLFMLVGSRNLLGLGFPYVGQLLPLPSAGELLHRFVTAWQPAGVGSTDPTSPATVLLGVAGYVLGGSTGLLQKVLVLGCLPVGAIGMARLVRPFGSSWARLAATVAYVGAPVAYDALALGRFEALLAYAFAPWIVARLARASGVAPYTAPAPDARRRAWRSGLRGQSLALGVLVAALCSLAPADGALVLFMGVAIALAVVVTGGGAAAAVRVLAVASGGLAVAVALLAPWSVALLSGPSRWEVLTGVALRPGAAPGWTSLLRLAVGPIGDTPLAFGLLAAAGLPLLIGARRRLVWAGTAWVLTLASLALAWTEGRGWTAGFALGPDVLLAAAAVGVSMAIGLGVAAFERDLAAHRFGWRQLAAALAAAGTVVGVLPVLVAAGSGRWDLPHTGFGEATTWMGARNPTGGFRVLWLADPRVLPGAGWRLDQGTAYALSEAGLPDATALWPGTDPGAAAAVARAVRQAEARDTVELGAALAPYAVRYVVVVDALAPDIPGYQSPVAHPAPDRLLAALASQSDLRPIAGQGGLEVFADDLAVPEWAFHVAPVATPASPSGPSTGAAQPPALSGWVPLPGWRRSATVLRASTQGGAVVLGRAPASGWQLLEPGHGRQRATAAFGYAARFDVPVPGGRVTVRQRGSLAHGLELAGEVAGWAVAVALLRRRSRPGRAGLRRRPAHAAGSVPS